MYSENPAFQSPAILSSTLFAIKLLSTSYPNKLVTNNQLMNAEELKNLQSPIKDKYRTVPESAIITLKAQGKVGEGISCKVETGRTLIEAGLHQATGGNGLLACSGD